MGWSRLLAVSLLVAACSPASNPATTPYPPPSTTSTTRATTTTLATTTTVDRLTEIEAIYQDLEYRRLDALYRGDREAFRAVHVDNGYLEESMVLFDLMVFIAPPSRGTVSVLTVLNETEDCIAMEIESDLVGTLEDATTATTHTVVLETLNNGWGISYGGTGWTCDGPHPFSS